MLQTRFSYLQVCRVVCVLLLAGFNSIAAQDLVFEDGLEQAALITNFSASADTILTGESTTLSWTTENATSCTPSGGAGDWESLAIDLPDGNAQIDISAAAAYTFTLSCVGTVGDPVVADEIVTASNCAEPPLSGTSIAWNVFWNDAFPNPVYSNVEAAIPRNGYYAIEFNTADAVDTGQLVSVELTKTTGMRLGSISECEGDFDVLTECKYSWGLGGGIIWSTDNYPGSCKLEPDTTYYFNITFTDGFNDDTSQCLGDRCFIRLRAINPQ